MRICRLFLHSDHQVIIVVAAVRVFHSIRIFNKYLEQYSLWNTDHRLEFSIHPGLEDAVEEMGRMRELEDVRKELEKLAGKKEGTKVSKRILQAGQPDSEYDSGCEKQPFFVAREAMDMVFLKEKSG